MKPKVKEAKVKDDILADLGISERDEEDEEEEEEIIEAPVAAAAEGIDAKEVQQEMAVWRMIELFLDAHNVKDKLVRFLGFDKKEMVGLVQREKAKLAQQQQPNTERLEMVEEPPPVPQPTLQVQPDESSDGDGSDGLIGDDVEVETKEPTSNGDHKVKERDQKEESSVDQPGR